MVLREVRDPIHGFIEVSDLEARLIDTRPVQRLRFVRQLSLGFLVWPGATHTRFEHALGTMELAGRAFDAAVENTKRYRPEILNAIGWHEPGATARARQLVRLGGLLHDVGHSPFSHGPEDLFVGSITHEDMTGQIIRDSELASELKRISHLGFDPEDVVAVAIGVKYRGEPRHQQVRMLSHLVAGALGVDRMDYLMRDSHYTGVGYGQFDVNRLISTLRISEIDGEPQWAIEAGGEFSAEQMLLARWFMHLQVYNHKTRRILDLHLKDFLEQWLSGGQFPITTTEYLRLNDDLVLTGVRSRGNAPHRDRLLGRRHARLVREYTSEDFPSSTAFRRFATSVSREITSARLDEFNVGISGPGEGELFIHSDAAVIDIRARSSLLSQIEAKRVYRIYADESDRASCLALIQSRRR